MNTHRAPLRERFDRHVVRSGDPAGCWTWTGATMPNGYGKIGVPCGPKRRDWRARLAHRVAYQLANGEIPEGLEVLHRCDVRACVNPAHLFVGTQKENMADMDAKGRRRVSSNLKNHEVALIRHLADCGVRQHRLVALFGVSTAAVSRIALRVSWPRLPDLLLEVSS